MQEFLRGDSTMASAFAPDGADQAFLLPYKHILSPDSVFIGKIYTCTPFKVGFGLRWLLCLLDKDQVLGSGEFGVVHRGTFNSEPVAIKTLKSSVEVEEFKAVLSEVKIMAYVGNHESIIKFIGAETSEISKRNDPKNICWRFKVAVV